MKKILGISDRQGIDLPLQPLDESALLPAKQPSRVVRNHGPARWRILATLAVGWFHGVLLFWDAVPVFAGEVFFLMMGVGLGLAWFILLLTTLGYCSREKVVLVLTIPLVGILGVAGIETDVGLGLRLWLCENQLKQYAANAPPNPQGIHAGERVGLFQVTRMQKSSGAFCLYDNHGFLNRCGIAYVPPGTGPLLGIRMGHRVYGDWYTSWSKF
jgi:hypothetical protein